MSTKLNKKGINPEFEDLFSFQSQEDKIEHKAQMISYKILSEVEKICDEKKIRKKDLADMVGTSRSYITQLFRGSKHINTFIMAKIEDALDISFDVKAKLDEDSREAFLSKQLPIGFFGSKRLPAQGCVMYCFTGNKEVDRTEEFVSQIKTENKQLQKAV
jgi:DNA-binding Xre family transcriptional regulator